MGIKSKNLIFQEDSSIKLVKSKLFSINITNNEIIGLEGERGFLIDSGTWGKKFSIEFSNKDNKSKNQDLILWGTKGSLEKIKNGDKLLVLDKDKWERDKDFAIIVREGNADNIYQRIGLMEVSTSWVEKLQKAKIEEIEQTNHIEIPPQWPPKGT